MRGRALLPRRRHGRRREEALETRRRRHHAGACVKSRVFLAVMLVGIAAHADEPQATVEDQDPATIFREANDALAGERPSDAITKLESLGDKGVVDAVASFDRGLAYARRVRAGATVEQPGDL